METDLKTTPLHEIHVALGARMMPFGGFDMPVQYTSILDEHHAVRQEAGLFDVSHMGEVRVTGTDALAFVHHLVTNNVAAMEDGQALYTVMCRETGCAVDDLLVYRIGAEEALLVINASNIDKDLEHIHAVHGAGDWDCSLADESEETALLALQGPNAFAILASVTEAVPQDLPYYRFVVTEPGAFLGCERAMISHTGYTGERGVEIYCETEKVVEVWEALMKAGAAHGLRPAGLGARDTLRLEAGYCLYGHELTEETTPLEAGLGWVVKLDAGDFVGREALAAQKAAGVPRRLVGFVMTDRAVPRHGYPITDAEGAEIGTVTSGSQSPVLGKGVGLGLVPNDPAYTAPGNTLSIAVRNRRLGATVTKPPFHKTA